MSQTHMLLSQLTEGKDDQTIKVRVTRIWDGVNLNTGQIMNRNIILLDEEDHHILLVLRANQRSQYMNKLEEDNVYMISNFKILPGPARYKPISTEKVINFFHKSTVNKVNNSAVIPRYKFELSTFEEAKELAGNYTQLIDIIGRLITVTDIQMVGSGIPKLDIVLTNERSDKITITMWAEKAENFKQEFANQNDDFIVLIVTGTTAKEFRGEVNLSSTAATKVYFNINYHAVTNIVRNMHNNADETTEVEIVPNLQRQQQQDNDNIQRLCIDQLLDATLPSGKDFIYCTIEAIIDHVISDYGWYYIACTRCMKKIKGSSTKLQCENCLSGETTTVQRYKVTVQVSDTTGKTTFVMFNRETKNLIGIPIEHLINNQQQIANVKDIPPVITNLRGKKCNFQVKITPYNTEKGYEEYTVTRVQEIQKEQKEQYSNKKLNLDKSNELLLGNTMDNKEKRKLTDHAIEFEKIQDNDSDEDVKKKKIHLTTPTKAEKRPTRKNVN